MEEVIFLRTENSVLQLVSSAVALDREPRGQRVSPSLSLCEMVSASSTSTLIHGMKTYTDRSSVGF